MNLKLKAGLEEAIIYIPFENRNVLGKFIDKGLYPYLYDKLPELFDVIEVKKTTKDDILINNAKPTGSSNTEGKIA
jgi:hypothetical protein